MGTGQWGTEAGSMLPTSREIVCRAACRASLVVRAKLCALKCASGAGVCV